MTFPLPWRARQGRLGLNDGLLKLRGQILDAGSSLRFHGDESSVDGIIRTLEYDWNILEIP